MLKRSFLIYLFLIIILLRMDFNMIHSYRLKYLGSLHQVGYLRTFHPSVNKPKDSLSAIHYYDYARRLYPGNIRTWEGLINAYLSMNKIPKAHETLHLAFKNIPKNSPDYPKLLKLSAHLKENFPIK